MRGDGHLLSALRGRGTTLSESRVAASFRQCIEKAMASLVGRAVHGEGVAGAAVLADTPVVRDAVLDGVISGLASVVAERDATYVCVPITTGSRYLDWARQNRRASGSGPTARDTHLTVVEANLRAAEAIVARVRNHYEGRQVIDPTKLELPVGFDQVDYHALCTRVIARFATDVVLADGWEYSTGCTLELAQALRSGATVWTEDLQPFDFHEALTRLDAAQLAASEIDMPIDAILEARSLILERSRKA